MYKYEAVFIYPSGADKLAAGKEAVAQEFAGAGVKVLAEEDMAERELAYSIQGSDRGHYILYNIEAPDQSIGNLERTLKIKPGILRFHFYRQDLRIRQPKAAKPAAPTPSAAPVASPVAAPVAAATAGLTPSPTLPPTST